MFEAYRICPVLEWGGSDDSRELKPFSTLEEATEAQAQLMRKEPHPDFIPHIFWTLYGVSPEPDGTRTEYGFADLVSDRSAHALLANIVGPYREDRDAKTPGYYLPERAVPTPMRQGSGEGVSLTLKLDFGLLRQQKSALIRIVSGEVVSPEQEEAVEGILNLIDVVQDTSLEQGLASEEEIFGVNRAC